MNTFSIGVPGGGNVGMALDARIDLRLGLSDTVAVHFGQSISAESRRDVELLLHQTLVTWNGVLGTRTALRVFADGLPPSHVGLGSSAALQFGLLAGLNWLHSLPFSETELRHLLAAHYHEVVEGSVAPSFSTGLSSFLNLYGGFAVLSDTMEVLFHSRVPGWQYLFTVPINTPRAGHASEVRTVLETGRDLDRRDAKRKSAVLWTGVVPALRDGDLLGFGDAVRELQGIGSKRAEVLFYGEHIYAVIDGIRRDGVECVFLSAIGPGIVLVSNMAHQDLVTVARNHGLNILLQGNIDNLGMNVKSEAFPSGVPA